MQFVERWEEAVGPDIARHCRPTGLRGTVLEVSADSSVWCQQLQVQAPPILEALRSTFGDAAPSKLWFRVGR
jgi:predicted nucleic acid-binding Zn ribbon protein